ncbi:MAG TPA: flavin reductase family protein [Longimicrobiaceae bacterium]|nr:flavin reductase family protein [Longimicrobiaceae bacterium]
MSIDPAGFRRIMGHVATGVTVVAARHPETGRLHGLTASSLTSVSLEPPLVLVCIQTRLSSHACIGAAGGFSVSVLAEGHEELSRRFARCDVDDKFRGLRFRTVHTGAPVLEDALVWMDCRTWAAYPGGDHTIYVGEVVAAGARDGSPLLYHRGAYVRVSPASASASVATAVAESRT